MSERFGKTEIYFFYVSSFGGCVFDIWTWYACNSWRVRKRRWYSRVSVGESDCLLLSLQTVCEVISNGLLSPEATARQLMCKWEHNPVAGDAGSRGFAGNIETTIKSLFNEDQQERREQIQLYDELDAWRAGLQPAVKWRGLHSCNVVRPTCHMCAHKG